MGYAAAAPARAIICASEIPNSVRVTMLAGIAKVIVDMDCLGWEPFVIPTTAIVVVVVFIFTLIFMFVEVDWVSAKCLHALIESLL